MATFVIDSIKFTTIPVKLDSVPYFVLNYSGVLYSPFSVKRGTIIG